MEVPFPSLLVTVVSNEKSTIHEIISLHVISVHFCCFSDLFAAFGFQQFDYDAL